MPAKDQYELYFSEKLWAMIPSVYRYEDGLQENPGVLRALIEVLAKQAAILRRSNDSLWEDQFIELCNDWVVPYIGDLVGTRLISALNKPGRRVDVAKTIYYRRRKGTPRILEELINDIARWDGKLVENFLRLARAKHGLDPSPAPYAGRFTGTMPGGWADLRQQSGSELTDGPFDEFYHVADIRKHTGYQGRYNIPKLSFYLFRLGSFKVENVTPYVFPDNVNFTFDPSGRSIPMFNHRNRPENIEGWNKWHSAFEWELPSPMRCRLLNHAEYRIKEQVIQDLSDNHGLSNAAADELRALPQKNFKDENRLRIVLSTLTNKAELLSTSKYVPLLQYSMSKDCGKRTLLPAAIAVEVPPGSVIDRVQTVGADLKDDLFALAGKQLAIDPARGKFKILDNALRSLKVSCTYHYGFSGLVGAGTHPRKVSEVPEDATHLSGGGTIGTTDLNNDGFTVIDDSKTYSSISNKISIKDLTLSVAKEQRPYIVLDDNWVLNSGPNKNSFITLEGLWIGNAPNNSFSIKLRGDFECVSLRNCTLDPGGETILADKLSPVLLIVEGRVEKLCIDQTICGPIEIGGDGIIEELVICDSILHSIDPAIFALDLPNTKLAMNRVTVFGQINVHELHASEVILTKKATVVNMQTGCFRFSAGTKDSVLPRKYESFLFEKDTNHWFMSRIFGQPGYVQVSDSAPVALKRGAENGSEMGAFSSLLNPVKLDGLQAKIEEYMPFGLIPAFIKNT